MTGSGIAPSGTLLAIRSRWGCAPLPIWTHSVMPASASVRRRWLILILAFRTGYGVGVGAAERLVTERLTDPLPEVHHGVRRGEVIVDGAAMRKARVVRGRPPMFRFEDVCWDRCEGKKKAYIKSWPSREAGWRDVSTSPSASPHGQLRSEDLELDGPHAVRLADEVLRLNNSQDLRSSRRPATVPMPVCVHVMFAEQGSYFPSFLLTSALG